MKKVVFAAFLTAVAAGCATSGGEVQPMTQTITDWRGTLEAKDTADIRGAAAVRSGYGQTGASVTIAGADGGGTHPWHVHSGTCGSGGPIVGDATAYPVLNVGSNGDALASATLKVELSPTGSYYVNVHQSPTDLGTIIACIPLSH